MKKKLPYLSKILVLVLFTSVSLMTACNNPSAEKTTTASTDPAEANIKMYTHVWDEIINKGNVAMFNDSNFTKDVVMHVQPADIVGIDSAKAYYSNYLTGFSDVAFTIKDVFAQGNKLVKQWNFSGTHSGVFFGIPATGKKVNIDGVTIVRMQDGKIAEERDYLDNMEFMQQLGLMPR
ncbi:MAG: ester cyclase [Ferruginibacter sp.]